VVIIHEPWILFSNSWKFFFKLSKRLITSVSLLSVEDNMFSVRSPPECEGLGVIGGFAVGGCSSLRESQILGRKPNSL
jgi:hypothetical protein